MIPPNRTAEFWKRPFTGRLLAVSVALLAFLLVRVLSPGTLSALDERVGEFSWRAFPLKTEESRLVIVDIDEASLAAYGPWPWPRERIAELSRKLSALGATLQIYDIVFPDPRPGDRALAAEMSRHAVVLSQIFSFDDTAAPTTGRLQGGLDTPTCASPLPQARGYIGNAPGLLAAAGHIAPRIAADGAVRALPALVCFDGRAYPALGIAALLKAAAASPTLRIEAGEGLFAPIYRLTHPDLPGIQIPLDRQGDVRIPYRQSRQSFISVPVADVLAGRAPRELFRGVWALVGATAFGVGDAVPTPHGGAVAGVEVHAQFIAGLLDGAIPYTPRGSGLIRSLAAALGIGLLLLAAWRGPRPALNLPLIGLALAVALAWAHGALLVSHQLWLGWAAPALVCLLSGVFIGVAEHARARRERELVYRNLASYLPASAASRIAFHEPIGAIEARQQTIAALYVDLRNFSAYCETRPPMESAAILHTFFTLVDRIVREFGGVIEEYVGDAVLAVWEFPEPGPAASLPAPVAAAVRILDEGTAALPPAAPPGLEPLALGIGIEVGPALVGSFGPARRRAHTALGEPVTVATRLQALTADVAESLLLGPTLAASVKDDQRLVPLGEFLLEGLRQPRQIFAFRPVQGRGIEPRRSLTGPRRLRVV